MQQDIEYNEALENDTVKVQYCIVTDMTKHVTWCGFMQCAVTV